MEPRFKLGNIRELPMLDMVASPQQRKFGQDKRDTLTRYCLDCDVRFACNGGCPKDRFATSPYGEPGPALPVPQLQGVLRPRRPGRWKRCATSCGRTARRGELMAAYAAEDARRGRNDPCTCGSGRKWKVCHGDLAGPAEADSPSTNPD